MSKYIITKIGKIITQIAKPTDIEGYTIGVIKIMFPDEEEIFRFTKQQEKEWINANNKRMTEICKFMNDNNL